MFNEKVGKNAYWVIWFLRIGCLRHRVMAIYVKALEQEMKNGSKDV